MGGVGHVLDSVCGGRGRVRWGSFLSFIFFSGVVGGCALGRVVRLGGGGIVGEVHMKES